MKLSKCTYFSLLLLMLILQILQSGETVEFEHSEFEKLLKHPQEHWYNMTLLGTKIGYLYTYSEKGEYRGEKMLRIRTELVMDLNLFGQNLKMEINQIEYIDSNLTPRYFVFTSTTSDASEQSQIEGKIKNSVAHITTTHNGKTTKSELVVPHDTLSDSVSDKYLLSKKRLKIGSKLNYHSFNFDGANPQFIKAELRVDTKDVITYQDQEVPIYILDGKQDIEGGVTERSWVAQDGTIYKSIVGMMGLSIEATKTDMKTALGVIPQKPTANQIYNNAIRAVMWIVNPGIGEGSGVLIDKKSKLAVTNAHVTGSQNTIDVYFPAPDEKGELIKDRHFYLTSGNVLKRLGYYTKAHIIARNEKTDLAIIRLDGLPETAREIDWNLTPPITKAGELVYILGNPAKQELWRWTLGEFLNDHGDFLHIQSDVFGGNSGGPVLNKQGILLGIVARSDQLMNAAAIPIRHINRLLSESKVKHSRIRR